MSAKGRMMIHPLTLFQRLKYFPYKFHWHHMPGYKEMFFSFILMLPLMKKLENLTYSPSNVENHKKYLRGMEKEYEDHKRHLEGYYEDKHH